MLTDFLKECRKKKGLTQKAVAKAIGYEPVTITRWETGRLIPSEYAIIELCRLYELTESQIEHFFQFIAVARSQTAMAHIKKVCMPHLHVFRMRYDLPDDNKPVKLVIGSKNKLGL